MISPHTLKNDASLSHSSIIDNLQLLHKAGFRLVSLSENHKLTIKWGAVYDDPYYWQISDFNNHAVYSKFTNIASTVGKTHLKDSEGKELYLQVLDCDSEYIYDIITKRTIAQLPLEKFHNFFKDCLGTAADGTDFNKSTLFDVLKKITFITKTRELYGLHIWWLSHNQNKPILSLACKKGYEFEIKTDKSNGLCTLPPSTHREDKGFRYAAIGRTDKLLINDQLYDLLFGLFNESLLNNDYSYKNNKKEQNLILEGEDWTVSSKLVSQQQKFLQSTDLSFKELSSETSKLTVNLLIPFYKEGHRHNFALFFSGTAFHFRVSEKSASSIIDSICNKTSDIQEKPERLNTLHSTYKKGLEGKPLTGGPILAELMSRVNGCEISVANDLVTNLKKLWQQDISKEISIAKAKRDKSGQVKVKGTIIGLSSVYQLIKSVTMECQTCSWKNKTNYKIPKFKAQVKESNNCPSCSKEEASSNTATANIDYVATVDLDLQDMDALNEIERLPVKVFEKDTYNISAGEVVNITGDLHIVRKNDSTKNRLETVLFADSVDYVKRQEITLTEKDIREINDWKTLQEEQGKNLLDELVSLFASELIDLDNVKKGVLMACVNAGIRNVDNRFPKRMRIHALLIGDPGLAKTSVLEKATRLVPNSQYAGGQSSTGLSLTAQISKEDSGMYTLRFGPVVLAKDSLCAINEIGQLPLEEHKHFLDCMEENGISMAKHGFPAKIEAHPSIIATANPVNNKWQNSETISMREFPTLSQVIQRFDLIFIFRENTSPSYLRRYVDKRKKQWKITKTACMREMRHF